MAFPTLSKISLIFLTFSDTLTNSLTLPDFPDQVETLCSLIAVKFAFLLKRWEILRCLNIHRFRLLTLNFTMKY